MLTAVNLRLRRFELKDGEETFIGEIVESAIESASRARMSEFYRATIEELITYSGAGRWRRRNRLTSLIPIIVIEDEGDDPERTNGQ